MARRKEKGKGKSKAKGGTKSAPRRGLQASSKRQSAHSWPVQEATASQFSLADEARWQANHRTTAFDATKKLRQLPIQFVSAGYLEGTIKERPLVIEAAKPDSESSAASSPATSFSSLNNTQAMADMTIRSPSPSPSEASSSADEVVFRGRGQIPPAPVATPSSLPVPKDTTDAANLAATDDDASAPSLLKTPTATSSVPGTLQQEDTPLGTPQLTAASTDDQTFATVEVGTHIQVNIRLPPTQSVNEEVNSDADSVVDEGFEKRRGGRPVWEGTTTPWEHRSKPNIGWQPLNQRPGMEAFIRGDVNSRDAAMDDYIQNMDDFGLANNMPAASAFSQREMDLDAGNHNDWQPESSNQGEDRIEGTDNDSWSSAMLKDLEDLSTSSDVMDTVVRILSKRTAKSDIHYLCVYEGSISDDAHWLPAAFLTSPADKQLIQNFEEKLRARQLQQVDSSSASSSSDEDLDEIDDESMARRLQKQEELGLGSDELLLYGRDDIYIAPAGVNPPFDFGRPNKKRQARVRGRQQHSYPSASALADAVDMDPYGAFDIMDTDRPSLRPRKRGRRGRVPLELEDSDLNEQLQSTWENDRAKKRLKKAEREELRQQGLIGKKGKYQDTTTWEDVVDEIREFLFSERTTLALPPMDAHHRATIHQASEQFNLTSRSQGAGKDRFIVLYKTGRTRTWTEDEFNIVIQRRNFFKRLRGPLHRVPFAKKEKAAVRPRVGYKDGDTVGGNAPELGPENKGHALLEKMGWSKGMALGADDNKGILQPIAHLVKTNKAGLK